ncbi:hypothetical protein [Bacillus bombysepticus]|uniref:hypothetical protein n=1 Tax=Bacillus bombysepticus TaxID=658666 RepID=UPI003018F78B|nr:hypothetical protein [Bacillus cereus]HDR8511539.1 hypothetical protein [Bacillus cereus]HDR8535164.1 hypothetical protein [Bacillus cereus]
MKVQLNDEQQALRKFIEEKVSLIHKYFNASKEDRHEASFDFERDGREMADAAHKLHMQLDPKPKHHRYMIQNRGMSPENPDFYYHIHPVEDLLSYLDDITANDDPVDKTLGDTFFMNIYTSRWGHEDRYELIRNEKGWRVNHMSYDEQGGKDAEPILGYVLRHDSISYPRDLSSFMEDIWVRAEEEGLSHDEVQDMLNKVAGWISLTERNRPNDISR